MTTPLVISIRGTYVPSYFDGPDFLDQTIQTTGPVILGRLGVGGNNFGTAGQVLTSQGPNTSPSWEDAAGEVGAFSGGDITIDDKIIYNGDTDTAIRFPAVNQISFETGGVEHLRINPYGQLLHGLNTTSSSANAIIQGAPGTGILLISRSSNTPGVDVGLGRIRFSDSNHGTAAQVSAARDGGTWTTGTSQPTRLEFSVTPNGSSSAVEALRLSSAGALGVGGANYGTSGQVLTSNGSGAAPTWTTPSAGGGGSTITSTTSNVAGTSGVTFSSIPTDVRRVNLTFNNVSTTINTRIGLRLGGSGGLVASGYNFSSCYYGGAIAGFYSTNDILFATTGWADAANVYSGTVEITRHSNLATTTNVVYQIKLKMFLVNFNYIHECQGVVTLPTEITQVRFMPEASLFDSGSVEIDYLD
jgi:hypothetical protein